MPLSGAVALYSDTIIQIQEPTQLNFTKNCVKPFIKNISFLYPKCNTRRIFELLSPLVAPL